VTSYLLDTSCLVAAVCAWHRHHDATRREIERRGAAGEKLVLAAHSLAEAFSVLTWLPEPHRLRPDDALALIEANWRETQLVALTGPDDRATLRRCRDVGIGGGAVYDALIAACARRARVATLVTWDLEGFERFLEDEPAVRAPEPEPKK
jgi:predicted nucleic acid-binding protein